ncbi:MAG: chemotaxis protein CheW [Deltaproteobacteria bacterium]|nr:chemotaxis protein CheW [Deltaproteobacteria bacterium]
MAKLAEKMDQAVKAMEQREGKVKGVINLRGKVIPIIDLRLRFGMETIDYTERTCIIVVEIESESGTVQVGVVVDAVSEVLNVNAEDIENTPQFGISMDTEYILGMAKMEGGVKILLDVDQVLTGEETEAISKVKTESPQMPVEVLAEQPQAVPEQAGA